jgi:hypothetical protein
VTVEYLQNGKKVKKGRGRLLGKTCFSAKTGLPALTEKMEKLLSLLLSHKRKT